MSTIPPAAPVPSPPDMSHREIKIVSHSSLFYWWPVWSIGFILAGITFFSGERMAIVPEGTQARTDVKIETFPENRDVLVLPKGAKVPIDEKTGNPIDPHKLRISNSKNLGVLFCIVLLLVIAITNIPLRGLWSVIVIVFIIFIVIILAILDKWETILETFSFLDIRINLGGYLLISCIL